jgi:hypothetical protein
MIREKEHKTAQISDSKACADRHYRSGPRGGVGERGLSIFRQNYNRTIGTCQSLNCVVWDPCSASSNGSPEA